MKEQRGGGEKGRGGEGSEVEGRGMKEQRGGE